MTLSFLIVGTPRSGTTLVQRLACELPSVTMPPETHFFSSGYARALVARGGFPLTGVRLDQELAEYAGSYKALVGKELLLDVRRIKAIVGESCRDPVELFAGIVSSLAGPGAIVGEKTPDHIRWWRPISRAMPDLKFVFVVRDPRAAVESIIRMPWGSDCHIVLAERWRMDQLNTIAATRVLRSQRCLVTRYEDVVLDPARFSRSLGSFLELPEGVGDPLSHPDASIVLPWETWKEGSLGPITSERANHWQASLPPDQALDVAAICQAEMRRLGYQPPGNVLWAYRRRLGLPTALKRRDRGTRRSLKKRQAVIDSITLSGRGPRGGKS